MNSAEALKNLDKAFRIMVLILAANLAVALAKALYGGFIHSASMVADGFHSLTDAGSSLVGLFGIRAAAKPRDAKHPYGHRKFETVASLGIAVMLAFVCVGILRAAFHRFLHPLHPHVTLTSYLVMAGSVAASFAVSRYEFKMGKALGSDVLVADSYHTRSDIYSSLSVLVALAAVQMGAPILDPVGAIVIVGFIGWGAWTIVRKGVRVLADEAVLLSEEIQKVALEVEGVLACHEIRTRGREDDVHVDLHLIVPVGMTVGKAHEVAHEVEERIEKAFPGVSDVIVHIEPPEHVDKEH